MFVDSLFFGLVIFILLLSGYCFFFFKQKTAYEMRISDWSSDVCSSDLIVLFIGILFWLLLMLRAMIPAMRGGGDKNLIALLCLSVVAIGLFYGSGDRKSVV